MARSESSYRTAFGIGLRCAIAIALLFLVLRYLDGQQLILTLSRSNPRDILGAVVAYSSISVFEALRLKFVVAPSRISIGHGFRLQVIASAFANVTPGQIGGDAYKVARLGTEGHAVIPLSVRLIWLRILSFLLVVVGAAVAIVFNPQLVETFSAWVASELTRSGLLWLGTIASVGFGILVSVTARSLRRIWRACVPSLDAFALLELGLASASILILRVVVLRLLCRSVGFEVDVLGGLLVATCSVLASVLPISIAGAGVREGVIVLLLTTLTASYEQSVAVALMGRLLMICQGAVGVGWWFVQRAR